MDENFAIQLFEGKKVRIVWDAEKEKYYFSVADIVQVLTDSADVKQYIKRMRARDAELNSKWGTICTPIVIMAESQRIAQEGGSVARDARQTMERRLGRSVVSPERASDYIKPIEGHDTEALPFTEE